jgi:glycosyltransferase involved in cell wall biosynthesis
MPSVSVIIPTYNHRDYIVRSLESVFSQTFDDHEVIVVNDGSPDDTAEVLAPYVRAGRIRYIEQPNAGQAAARNRGIREAAGAFVAFLDDDDLWPPDKLAWQVSYLASRPTAGAVGGAVDIIDEAGERLDAPALPMLGEIAPRDLFRGSPFLSPGQTLIRTDLLRSLGGLDERIWGADDFDLWFRIAERSTLLACPRLALHYRLHPANASKDATRMFANVLRVIRTHLRHVPIASREAATRQAYRFLYRYMGKSLMRAMAANLAHGRLDAAALRAGDLATFLGPALLDWHLVGYFCDDLYRGARLCLRARTGTIADPGAVRDTSGERLLPLSCTQGKGQA